MVNSPYDCTSSPQGVVQVDPVICMLWVASYASLLPDVNLSLWEEEVSKEH